MKNKNTLDMMDLLKKSGVHVCGTHDDFYGRPENNDCDGIWISGESTPDLFDYYSSSWANTFGVEPKINAMVEKYGWYFEWYDPGTMMLWKNN